MPESTMVAGPVRVASAISRTGAVSVEVKYSVRRLSTWASTRPMIDGAEALPAGVERCRCRRRRSATIAVPMTVSRPAVRKPRLIGAIADLSLSVARTANTPTIDASTPMARAASGKIEAERRVERRSTANAATPRMIDATSVTS